MFRNWPIESLHKQAFQAAEAAECAADQGKFWEMHARLFANQSRLGQAGLIAHASALGLSVPIFQRCLESRKYSAKVRKDLADGQAAGITGTPAFFIGPAAPGSQTVRALETMKGAKSYAEFKQAIDRLLAQSGQRAGE